MVMMLWARAKALEMDWMVFSKSGLSYFSLSRDGNLDCGGILSYQGYRNRPVIRACYLPQECSSVYTEDNKEGCNRHGGP